jgi:uncharacterized protein YbaP (TraB family)
MTAHARRHTTLLAAIAGFLLVAAYALAPASLRAEGSAKPAAKAKTSKPSRAAGLLFKLESTSATVYVLGSIHVANDKLYPLDSRITTAFERSDVLVLETELTPTAKARAAKLLQQTGSYTPPDTLYAHLDDSTRAALQGALAQRNIPPEAVQVMRPWLVSLTLTLVDLGGIGFKPELGIDEHFRARGTRKHMTALETVEQQVAMFKDMPEAVQLASLRQTLEQLPDLERIVNQAFDAWRAGDAAALDGLLIAPMRKEFPKLYERMFVERNRRMADAIAGYLEGNATVFVVVGSGHLVGPNSVLQVLKQRGLASTQI